MIAAVLKVTCEWPHALYFEMLRGLVSSFSIYIFIFSFPFLFFFEVVNVTEGIEMGIISDD